jgi:hypothetical protein
MGFMSFLKKGRVLTKQIGLSALELIPGIINCPQDWNSTLSEKTRIEVFFGRISVGQF